jgi:transposase-like protein
MEKKTRKQYSAQFKAKVVKEMLREEKAVGQLAAEYGVHSNMLYRWRDQALAGLPGLFSDQVAQELVRDARLLCSKSARLYTPRLAA